MRVTAGKYRRLHLRSMPSPKVRPTARRLREALFDLLGARIEGARFLDLCAGSGAVGIEALSRGAAHATFVDRSPKVCGLIESNLDLCEVAREEAEVLTSDVMVFLSSVASRPDLSWEIAFFDPPYAADYAPVLALFGTGAALRQRGGVLVVEHYYDNKLEDAAGIMRRWRVIRQGDSCLSFYERRR
ncbi:MAG: 16S rRNA (guanine(966)-N(2))-methyltransferase RsmD [Pyrinomonadaceae bacterium]